MNFVKIIAATIVTVLLTGCYEKGYKQIDGTWYWVKWDEGGGRKNPLEDLDVASFKIIDSELAMDKDSVWDCGLVHFSVNTSKVEFLGRSWVKDDKMVYTRNGHVGLVAGINAKAFKEIYPGVFSDGIRYFIDSQEVSAEEAKNYIKTKK